MPLQASSIIQDVIKYIRDDLATLTDPIASLRSGRERFVLTGYPQRETVYPIITVKLDSFSTDFNMGFQSISQYIELPIEIRIWARNYKEKDTLTDLVINRIRNEQFTVTTGYKAFGLHDWHITSMTNVDESGDAGIKSRIINIKFKAVYGDVC
jgi:hypothetical protein